MAEEQNLSTLAQRSCDNLNEIQSVIEETSGESLNGVKTEEYGTILRGMLKNTGAKKVEDLENVNITELKNNEILQYDIATMKWINRAIEEGLHNLIDLEDIEITEVQDRQVLMYDSMTGKWTNKTIEISGGGTGESFEYGGADVDNILNNLED